MMNITAKITAWVYALGGLGFFIIWFLSVGMPGNANDTTLVQALAVTAIFALLASVTLYSHSHGHRSATIALVALCLLMIVAGAYFYIGYLPTVASS
jgi:hypothetical protein